MGEIAQLSPKPKTSDIIKEEAIRILREVLSSAENGDVTEVIVVLKHPDGTWSNQRSGTMATSNAIGYLEILKHCWIKQYMEEE